MLLHSSRTGSKWQELQSRLRKAYRLGRRYPGDSFFRGIVLLAGLAVLVIVGGLILVLVSNSWPTISTFGWRFLVNEAFDPIHQSYGVRPAIFGTVVTSTLALALALPLGIGAAIYLAEFCPRQLQVVLTFLVDSLAAIPSVVLGLWGFLTFAPWLQQNGEPWLQQHLGWLPFFQGSPHGLGLLAAICILMVMILPILISLGREVLETVPREQREALLALGATDWEVIRHAVLPAARSGLAGAAMLALGRALGETIAVTLVIGNQAAPPSLSLFQTGYTLPSIIANQFGEATPGLFLSAVLEAGCLLLLITLLTNILARLLITRLTRGIPRT
ncbi:phosphate ABC transporter permease subunit PstC [Thermogemmatispora carboxidivorans]|uniref:phosphate ABC transporter permease subunit PstC n=1 Tax=Thermogemmatispora carboxidivorans TaxID=1382306 RepID=UPI0009DE0EEF|nr:phosphate ABC transporter permease subunit PstC [Thermogemmatispora carboxidivorans]